MTRIVHADRVIPGPAGADGAANAVLVRDHLVAAVGDVEELRAADPAVPVDHHPGCSITPGLINSHVHLAADLSREPFGTVLGDDHEAMRSVVRENARACLRGGVTTVRDLGDRRGLVFDHRDAVRRGEATGPRVLAAGSPLTVRGGHCWFLDGVAESAAEIRDHVDALAARADVVKVMAGGGQMTPGGPSPYEAQYDVERLALVVEHAARHGLPVAAHAHGTAAIVACIEARVTTIEHCGWRSAAAEDDRREDAVRRMAAHGVIAGDTTPPQWRRMAARIPRPAGRHFGDQLTWMVSHGVEFVAGTDSGMPSAVFDRFVESLELYRELGFAPATVLDLVTATAARLLGLGGVTGQVAPGLEADLLVVEGDPRADLGVLHRPRLVMARGRALTREDLEDPRALQAPGLT